ncbi:class I adenylate-forming enzyme family protein [Desulfamplus magnetovallimortis]|nr:class I adenylate-forming enzyme family protein [Desulfamplus magnetovallimortis]
MISDLNRINIVDTIRRETASYLSRYAVSQEKKSITYGELLEKVEELSLFLVNECGIEEHYRVALLCEDSIEYIITALALLDIGAVMLPASPSLSSREFDSLCQRMEVNCVICQRSRDIFHKFVDLSEKLSIYNTGKKLQPLYNDGKKLQPFCKEEEVIDPAFIRFSSGTTGMSKGVLLTHSAIIQRTDAADERLKITESDTIAWFLSMSYHFVVTILLFLRRGAHIVLCGDSFPKGAAEAFQRHPPSFLYASPFHYTLMTRNNDFSGELLSNVRMAISTAMALEKKVAVEFMEKFHIALVQAYGIIEVGLPFINHRTDDEYIASVGQILPAYQMKLEDKDLDGRGRILLKGKGMFEGYVSPWQRREEWFDTGDIGEIKDGFLFICGRKKNLINFNGMKIFPEEVEQAMLQFEGIEEVKVYGETHRMYGQLPVAQYTVSGNVKEIDLGALKRFLKERLDIYKIPKEFVKTDIIEKTLSGKIQRC